VFSENLMLMDEESKWPATYTPREKASEAI